jgi:ABC-type glutathione transport system ATPase component
MASDPPILRARGLTRTYVRRGARRGAAVRALDGVDLAIARGAAVALVGQSGSGKSTLARCLARLEQPDAGEVWLDETDVRRVQLVFQDAATALSPRLTAAAIVSEPLDIRGALSRAERRQRALELMRAVGLDPAWADRRPLELSGGQRQRLGIARALAVQPALLILDEAFSGLDPSIQAQMAALLEGLRARLALTLLYISHDLALMSVVADEVAVMFEGRIVEQGPPARLLADAQHPHTRALVAAMPAVPGAAGAASS